MIPAASHSFCALSPVPGAEGPDVGDQHGLPAGRAPGAAPPVVDPAPAPLARQCRDYRRYPKMRHVGPAVLVNVVVWRRIKEMN